MNDRAIRAAERVAHVARTDLRARLSAGSGAVIVEAPAGAGKSTFVVDTVLQFADEYTILVGAPTNEQVFSLVGALGRNLGGRRYHYVPKSGLELPFAAPPGAVVCRPASQARGARIVVATLHKLADAHQRGDIDAADLLIVDEAFQATSGVYYQIGDIAPCHLLVGDAGQIDPFSTAPAAAELRGLAEDPVRTSVEVLRESHPATPVHRLPISRRLDERAVPAIRAFYDRGHHFEAAAPTGTRRMQLVTRINRNTRQRRLDEIVRAAASDGWAHVELPAAPSLPTDHELIDAAADLVFTALHPDLSARTDCERYPDRPLNATSIAVGASHREQVRSLRRALRRRGLACVTVDTANRLQGLEFDLVVCLHPLAGLPTADAFHLESGRLCVLVSRHRHACIVLGRASDRHLLEQLPPSGEAYIGREDEPLLDGWDVHQRFFEAIAPFRHPLEA